MHIAVRVNKIRSANFLKKIFTEGYWECRYRSNEKIGEFPNLAGSWTGKLIVSKRYWCADPFLVQENGKTYAFVELMDRYHSYGVLGCAEIKSAIENAKVRIIKDLGFHSSYPDVFKYKGQWYMIPETSANSTIELYKAENFPEKWQKLTVLADRIKAVDCTVFSTNNKLYLFIYQSFGDENQLAVAELHPEEGYISNYQICKEYHQKIGRPAGNVLSFNNEFIRPTQFGINRYGEKLVFKKFKYCLDDRSYTEEDIFEMRCEFFPDCRDFTGLHTYARTSEIEMIDLYKKKFNFLRPLILVLKKLKMFGFR